MKNKNGFTLVELLITITLMLTILVLAIISFNRVSKNKKDESWETVKLQVEAAATEYFTANEYLFEGLSDNSSGSITIGKLVEEDYLGKVIDPRNGTVVDNCSLISVAKKGNKLTAKYADRTGSGSECDNNYIVYISEPGAPKISADVSCTKAGGNDNPWCTGDATVNITFETKNNGAVSLNQNSDAFCSDIDANNNMLCENNGSKNIKITATNTSNKTSTAYVDVKIDKNVPQKPTIQVDGVLGNNGWYKERTVKLSSTGSCSNISGCVLKKGTNNSVNDVVNSNISNGANINSEIYSVGDTGSTTRYSKICSGAGLCSDVSSRSLKVDTIKPTVSVSISSKNDKYNTATASVYFSVRDTGSGLDTVRSNIKNTKNETSWSYPGGTSWNNGTSWSPTYNAVVSSTEDGSSVTPRIEVIDKAGNSNSNSASKYTVHRNCSQTKLSGSCANSGYRTKVDKYTDVSCNVKEDCSISDIAVLVNRNDANASTNPGMSGEGPAGTTSKKGIFDCSGTYDYSNKYKRGINSITLNVSENASTADQWNTAWDGNWMTYAASSCMYVGDFERRLVYRIKWSDGTISNDIYTKVKEGFKTSDYTSRLYTGRSDGGIQIKINEDDSAAKFRDCKESDLSDGKKAETCGKEDKSTPNLTKHVYYLSYGNVKSNKLALYTKYFRSY